MYYCLLRVQLRLLREGRLYGKKREQTKIKVKPHGVHGPCSTSPESCDMGQSPWISEGAQDKEQEEKRDRSCEVCAELSVSKEHR